MKQIKLLNVDKMLCVDESDFKKMSKHTWYFKASTGYAYRMEKDKETGKWKHITAQRDISPVQRVRFIDGNRLNCQRTNLKTR